MAGIGDVARDEVGARVLRHAFALESVEERDPLDLAWARAVERHLALAQQGCRQLLADEAGAAGDQNPHRRCLPLARGR